MYKVIDLETTGLRNQDDIVQLAIWTLNDKLNAISYANYYFDIPYEMPEKAYAVNKLSRKFLHENSGGKCFSELKEIVAGELSGHTLVAHNAVFEKRVLGEHMNHAFDGNKWICTMRRYTPTLALKDRTGNGGFKQCNLRELTAFCLNEMGIDQFELDLMYRDAVGELGSFHNALYDAYCTALAFNVLG